MGVDTITWLVPTSQFAIAHESRCPSSAWNLDEATRSERSGDAGSLPEEE